MKAPLLYKYTWTIKLHDGSFRYIIRTRRSDGRDYVTFASTLWGARRLVRKTIARSESAARGSKHCGETS